MHRRTLLRVDASAFGEVGGDGSLSISTE